MGLLQQWEHVIYSVPTPKFNTWDFEMEKARKKLNRTAKFEVCSIEI